MKKTIFLTALFTLLLLAVVRLLNAQTLVASYPFNGNANDISGNGNNGTTNNVTLTNDRFGNANSAYSFNGTVSSYIQVANSTSLQLSNSYTLSAWVKPNAFFTGANQANFIIGKGNQGSEGHYNLQYGDFLDGNPGILTPSQMNFASTIHKGGTEQYAFENPVTNPVQLNNWYYVVTTFDGTTLKLYVNGALRSSSIISGTFGVLNGGDLFIGKSADNTYFVNGIIDDIQIYDAPLTASQIFDRYVTDIKKPGSGNGLQLNRTNSLTTDPWVNIGSGYDFSTQPFTYETWVKRDDLHLTLNNYGVILIVSDLDGGWGVGIDNSNTLFFTKVGINGVFSTGTIADTKWHHVAVVYTGTQIQFYIDGITAGSSAYTDNFTTGGNYIIGARQSFGNSNGDQTLNGMIDETRIWRNIALTQTQIRDWMCKKVTSSHPAYNNLYAYFRFDENSGPINGFNSKFGILNNNPLLQTSGAPLGDATAHDFVNATKAANLSATTGENFSVTSTSGSPSGITVYRVDETPNSNAGANNGGNNKYFGVFQSGGTSPQYTAVYNYTGNPLVNAGNEASLRLAKRADNSVSTWTQINVPANEPSNTITVTGESTEYILGQVGSPLPVTLLSFAGSKCSNQVCLQWTVENEQNFSHYEIEKSNPGSNFNRMVSLTANNSFGRKDYSAIDINPVPGINFYRLKIVNLDNTYTYSKEIRIDFNKPGIVSIQPVPANDFVIIKGINGYTSLQIVDMSGRMFIQKSILAPIEQIDIARLPAGIYAIQLINKNEINTLRLIKH